MPTMERRERDSVIAKLIDALRTHGSWCGETNIQKAAYFLQTMAGIGTGFPFILYKHGPFSFELRDELTAMRADRLLDQEFPRPDYGPTLRPTPNMKALSERFQERLEVVEPAIEFIAERLGDKNVAELERLATALYVLRKYRGDDLEDAALADHIVQLKPHVAGAEAREAIRIVKGWDAEAARFAVS